MRRLIKKMRPRLLDDRPRSGYRRWMWLCHENVRFHSIPKAFRTLLRALLSKNSVVRSNLCVAAGLRESVPGWLDRRRCRGGMQPSAESLLYKLRDRAPVFDRYLQPRKAPHLREINSPETQSRDKNVDAVTQRLLVERIHRLLDCLRTIRVRPTDAHLGVSFFDTHFQRRVSHREGYELLPVLHPREPPGSLKPLVERRRGQRRQQPEDRQAGRPTANLFQGPLCHAGRVIVHAENKRRDRIDIPLGKPLEHCRVLTRLVEALFHVREVRRIDGFHADEDPLSS